MNLFPPNLRCCWSIELVFLHPLKQQQHIYPPWYFDAVPGEKVNIQILLKRIAVLIPIIIWSQFGQMLLPAPGWHLLKLKIDELKIEMALFDPGRAVSHWIDGVRSCCCLRRSRRRFLLYIYICRILLRSWTGRGDFVLGAWCNREQEFYYGLLLYFRKILLISCWIFGKGF